MPLSLLAYFQDTKCRGAVRVWSLPPLTASSGFARHNELRTLYKDVLSVLESYYRFFGTGNGK